MSNSPVFVLFLVVLIGLGAARIWSMFKVANMIPMERRTEMLTRLQKEGLASGTDWDQLIRPGATQLLRFNRSITRLGLVTGAAFIIFILATSLLK